MRSWTCACYVAIHTFARKHEVTQHRSGNGSTPCDACGLPGPQSWRTDPKWSKDNALRRQLRTSQPLRVVHAAMAEVRGSDRDRGQHFAELCLAVRCLDWQRAVALARASGRSGREVAQRLRQRVSVVRAHGRAQSCHERAAVVVLHHARRHQDSLARAAFCHHQQGACLSPPEHDRGLLSLLLSDMRARSHSQH